MLAILVILSWLRGRGDFLTGSDGHRYREVLSLSVSVVKFREISRGSRQRRESCQAARSGLPPSAIIIISHQKQHYQRRATNFSQQQPIPLPFHPFDRYSMSHWTV